MPDRRLFDLGQRVQDAVELPDFDDLRGRGRRLVRTRIIATAFTVAVVAATGLGVATSGSADSDPPVIDVPLRDLTPEQIVQHPRAELVSFAIDADDRDVRAAVWQVPCEAVSDDDTGRLCGQARQALAVSDDGFASATYVPLPDSVEYAPRTQQFSIQAVSAGRFYLAQPYRNGSIVDTEGLTPVAVSRVPAPLGADEVFLGQEIIGRREVPRTLGLDVDTARAHVLRSAPGWFGFGPDWQSSDGTLWDAHAMSDRVITSTDGGETWSRPRAVPNRPDGGVEVRWVPSAADQTVARVQADVFLNPISLVRSTDGGRTWDDVGTPDIEAHWIVVRPDGSLLMLGGDGQTYASNGTDWADLRVIEPGIPDSVEWESVYDAYAQSVVDADGTQTVYVVGDTDQTVWASTDGSHWEETPAR